MHPLAEKWASARCLFRPHALTAGMAITSVFESRQRNSSSSTSSGSHSTGGVSGLGPDLSAAAACILGDRACWPPAPQRHQRAGAR